ncbi:hypothetical protein IMZ29_21505 [Achromobacter sp. GG226]|uniref:hypothetical protein n=1 Tax=Verticiella alkaliphila TaxID=2779529 RepID=UPI001C0E8B44|nr:hypothetical protein [Verticiella sp. GG226]MBU4613024.1 hypothetical protein [Verticiella sp. GG226]
MWARISIFLVAALLVAAAAGAFFGHLLVQNAPFAPQQDTQPSTPISQVGADGQAYVPEPPQPRVDGSLGVPQRRAAGESAPLVSLLEANQNPGIAISTSRADDLDSLMARLQTNGAMGPGRSGIPVPSFQESGQQGAPAPRELPPELAFAVAQPAESAPAAPAVPAWQQSLRDSLGRCGRQRFFSEAECEQRLRVQYCEPNGGWGRVAECPATARNARF